MKLKTKPNTSLVRRKILTNGAQITQTVKELTVLMVVKRMKADGKLSTCLAGWHLPDP